LSAEHGVNPAEIREILGMAAVNDYWLVNAAHLTSSCQGVLGPACDHFVRESEEMPV
jgi:hypothetical protein